ncbi:hypothetical protein [Nitratidesulfovibrio vulgaris]|uniref:Uncharacterized protein n=1 Tax=Nitratidesulfovibrio vulgaris (strain ATCC 29579 / DSM 644 / CCUG 34227 / NCIMB 8303 / VKM B-1760 / Hildenborough) TaxID=882 RepID=Q72FH9_NITV2|nr:hypothetical protein [Nitratidesulfovibrio vulgaris]AAS94718.1 hypothetical protein DVU_0234 [Nitratidesulfovibrio vulgaris str. Hildenborough]
MTQNTPYIEGERLYRAFFRRGSDGLHIVEGHVIISNESRFVVRCRGSEESHAQTAPAGWHRSRVEALDHLTRGLEITRRRVEADGLVLKAKIQHTHALRESIQQEGM